MKSKYINEISTLFTKWKLEDVGKLFSFFFLVAYFFFLFSMIQT